MHTPGRQCDECEGRCLQPVERLVVAATMASIHIGQHVRHSDYKGERVTGKVRGLSIDSDRVLMADIVLDSPIVIPARDESDRPIDIWHQFVPVHELTPFDERDDLIAELLLACQGLLESAESGVTSLGLMRLAHAVIAKANGSAS